MSGPQRDSDESSEGAKWWHEGQWQSGSIEGITSDDSIVVNAEEYPELARLIEFSLDDDVDGYLRAIGIDDELISELNETEAEAAVIREMSSDDVKNRRGPDEPVGT